MKKRWKNDVQVKNLQRKTLFFLSLKNEPRDIYTKTEFTEVTVTGRESRDKST